MIMGIHSFLTKNNFLKNKNWVYILKPFIKIDNKIKKSINEIIFISKIFKMQMIIKYRPLNFFHLIYNNHNTLSNVRIENKFDYHIFLMMYFFKL